MTTREVLKTVKKEDVIKFISTKASKDDVYKALAEKGLTDNFKTFVKEFDAFINEKRKGNVAEAELTEEQLEQVAGGSGDDKVTSIADLF